MTIFVLPLLITFFAVVILTVRVLFLMATGKAQRGIHTLKIIGAWLIAYAAVLIGVGLASRPQHLALGDAKCFDDWCFSANAVTATPGGYIVHVATTNRGRRPQRPDSPHLNMIRDGRPITVDCPQLTDRIAGRTSRPFSVALTVPASARDVELLVTEGGFPSRLTIDDENSPFHAKQTWRIRR